MPTALFFTILYLHRLSSDYHKRSASERRDSAKRMARASRASSSGGTSDGRAFPRCREDFEPKVAKAMKGESRAEVDPEQSDSSGQRLVESARGQAIGSPFSRFANRGHDCRCVPKHPMKMSILPVRVGSRLQWLFLARATCSIGLHSEPGFL